MNKHLPVWKVFADSATLADALAVYILAEAQTCIAQRGRFLLVLAGGNTPNLVYAKLAQASADWSHWHIWFGDERSYPSGHPERNDSMAQNIWLQQVAIPPEQIHAIDDLSPPAAAAQYATTLPQEAFDLTLLGLGEDGHTASLFPNHDWGEGAHSPAVLAVKNAPKLPADRVSLSAQRLSQSNKVVFVVTGANKAKAVARWKAGHIIPACAIQAAELEAWIDKVAELGNDAGDAKNKNGQLT